MYDYWFTQFDFPNEEGKPYRSSGGQMVYNEQLKREIPIGWEISTISSIADILSGYAFSSNLYSDSGSYSLYTIKNVQDQGIISTVDNFINTLPINMPTHCLLSTGDILTSLTGNVGRIGIVYMDNCLLNQRVAKIHPKSPKMREFVYFTMKSNLVRKSLETLSNGSSQANLSPLDIECLKIPFDKALSQQFNLLSNDSIGKLYSIKTSSTNELSI